MINYLKNKSLMLMSQKEYIRIFWKKEFIIFMRSQKRFKCDKHDLPSMQINKIVRMIKDLRYLILSKLLHTGYWQVNKNKR